MALAAGSSQATRLSDYGHDLEFGSFLTPTKADPDAVVALVAASEAVGLDVATFQDHPYHPGLLDTWTLMSYTAARTTSIHLSANVMNLPLRQPAVIARSIASLDLLSRGRVELGIGAGAFWDAIEAMGGRRLSPGQAVRALEEAIRIIRGIWDAGNPHILHVDGEFYHVAGAKRGPAPAHDVALWLGAYQPKMLALTGRAGDGWLPSLSYLKPGDLDKGNRIIDEAALGAGRQPADVRRLLNIHGRFAARTEGLLNGPVQQWVEELAEIALTAGVSTFILGTDDLADIQRFGLDVAPAVRELVESERGPRRPGA
jgi:alkanesulfonate monooxygenase SsuD/methylene tetrahydromethanopterin reductase-like flavin-dependent oxidoreductase (luciferase family)